MKPGALWPLAVVAVLAVTVAANAVVLVLANDRDAAVVEPDYYRRALAWDSIMTQQAHDTALGWTLDARLGPVERDGRASLAAALADRDGRPVTGATVTVEAIHNREAATPHRARLAPAGDGYTALLPLGRTGLWELRFDVRRGAERFTATVRREAAAWR